MKNGLFTTMLSENDRGPGKINQSINCKGGYSWKEGDDLCMVGLEENCIFRAATKQQNHRFRRVMSSVG